MQCCLDHIMYDIRGGDRDEAANSKSLIARRWIPLKSDGIPLNSTPNYLYIYTKMAMSY